MTHYNSLNIKLSNSQLNKLRSAIKIVIDLVLRLSSNMVANSDDETNFPHKLLLTNRQTLSLRKVFNKHTSADVKFSKAQLTKMQKGGFLKFLMPLLKSGLPLLKSVVKPLGILDLTAAASATDAAINKKILGSGNQTTLIISNDDMQDGILLDGITETVKNEVKEQKGGFLSMLLGTLGVSLFGDLLTKNLSGRGGIRAGEGTIRAGYGTVTYFDSFGIEHIPKEVKKFIGNIISNIYRIQNYDSIMCGCFCIGFIDYMFKSKSLTDYTNLFSPNNFKKNDEIILNHFLNKL